MWPFKKQKSKHPELGWGVPSTRMSKRDYDRIISDLEHDYLACWGEEGCNCKPKPKLFDQDQ